MQISDIFHEETSCIIGDDWPALRVNLPPARSVWLGLGVAHAATDGSHLTHAFFWLIIINRRSLYVAAPADRG